MEDTADNTEKKTDEEGNSEQSEPEEDINRNNPSQETRYSRKNGTHEDFRESNAFSPRRQGSMKRIRRQEIPPIDEKTWFDTIISCGFGAKTYAMGPRFANPRFRVRFATKLYIVLLVQLLICIFWMSYVPASPSFRRFDDTTRGIFFTAMVFYGIIFAITRFSSCDGMCFLGHMIITTVMTVCLVIVFGGLVVIFPLAIFIVTALWCTLFLLVVANFIECTNVLTKQAYTSAVIQSLLSCSIVIAVGWSVSFPAVIPETKLYQYIVAVFIITPIISLYIVYEVKKLIGGRRAELEGHEWLLAAVIV